MWLPHLYMNKYDISTRLTKYECDAPSVQDSGPFMTISNHNILAEILTMSFTQTDLLLTDISLIEHPEIKQVKEISKTGRSKCFMLQSDHTPFLQLHSLAKTPRTTIASGQTDTVEAKLNMKLAVVNKSTYFFASFHWAELCTSMCSI